MSDGQHDLDKLNRLVSATPDKEREDLGDRADALAQIRLWFFRDMSEEQRRKLYGICGYSNALPERLTHGIEAFLFTRIFSALSKARSAGGGEHRPVAYIPPEELAKLESLCGTATVYNRTDSEGKWPALHLAVPSPSSIQDERAALALRIVTLLANTEPDQWLMKKELHHNLSDFRTVEHSPKAGQESQPLALAELLSRKPQRDR